MREIDLNKRLIAQEKGGEPIEIDGYKLIEPDGVMIYMGQRTLILPKSDVKITQQ